MNLLYALLLGIIQGLTEFLPISSTAHLLILQELLGLPPGDLMFAFLVIIQLGTVVSLIVLYWRDLLRIARATLDFRHPTLERNLGFFILIATVPAALIGYLLRHAVEQLFGAPLVEAAIRLLSAALLMSAAERFGARTRRLEAMGWLDAFVVGCFQVIAVFPGASRSAATISAGMLRGLDRASAARFAFLIAIPIMLGAGAYQLLDLPGVPGLREFVPALAVGFFSAAVFGWLSVRWLIGYISGHSLNAFAAYCGILGVIVLAASFAS